MDVFEDLAKEKKLTAPIIHAFQAQYGPKFFKALEFLQPEGPKVHKHHFSPSNLTLWVVQGKVKKYLVYPKTFCQCQAFLLNTIYRTRQYSPCKHLLAQQIASILNQINVEKHKDTDFKKWIRKFKK